MVPDTRAISRQVALELCGIQSEAHPPERFNYSSLVFPSYRPNAIDGPQRARVSEAEARILYCLALANLKLPFAVEVPTSERYTFSGTTTMSARTDLVVYSTPPSAPQGLVRNLAVEFKAHNPPIAAIRKDLEKLLREHCDGLWFHVLQNADSRTIPALMEKFAQAIGDLRDPWQKCGHTLALGVVVLQKRFWLYRTLTPNHDSAPDLVFDYMVQGKKIVVGDAKGWAFEAF